MGGTPTMIRKPISADSHMTEPPNCYVDHIDPKFRERAPRIRRLEEVGDAFVIEGMPTPVPLGLLAAAGKEPSKITTDGVAFEDLWRSGWDPKYRLADQDLDGVAAEFIYPTVGMLLCNHADFDFKKACFEAYNRWLAEYCAEAPDRLFGLAQVSMRSPEDGVAELKAVKAMGFKGVMMPGDPAVEDYDSKIYDPVWATAVELGLPLSFHILTTKSGSLAQNPRGPRINSFLSIIRGCQDIMGALIFSGVFDRHPGLKIVCVEADAGWAPHYMYRMDHAYKRHRYWDEGAAAGAPAQRIFRRAHLRHLPGRLGGVQDQGPVQRAPADVGQRLPALGFHLAALPGDARRAHQGPDRGRAQLDLPRQRGRPLRPGGELTSRDVKPLGQRP
jgi:predicted TIM-barrel fold metal-dependent hydrolase